MNQSVAVNLPLEELQAKNLMLDFCSGILLGDWCDQNFEFELYTINLIKSNQFNYY